MRRAFLLLVLAAASACDSATSPTPVCTYSLSSSSMSMQAAGGAASVTAATASQCSWTARSEVSWIAIVSGASATGTASVGFTVSPNTATAARTGTLTIAGLTATINQEAASVTCEYAAAPDRTSFTKDGGTGTVTVTAAGPCAWTAASDASWLTVTSGAQGTGNGAATFSVARSLEIVDRRANLVVAGRSIEITQSGDTGGCQYSVVPVELNVCMSVPNELTATITTSAGCPWTATAGAPWITVVSGQSGTGSGSVSVRVTDNYDPPRDAPVQVRWPTPTAGQNVRVFQAGCFYAVSTTSISVPTSGGSSTFDVLQQSVPNTCGGATQDRCVWTAESDVPWITITTPMPQSGDNRVNFSAAANGTGAARTGRIRVRDKTVVVTQP